MGVADLDSIAVDVLAAASFAMASRSDPAAVFERSVRDGLACGFANIPVAFRERAARNMSFAGVCHG